ncbi:AraC family transcriptional regulator [Kineothrix sedimenti]|uniref:AraC family transcriptional regulator n=1 Tax=Kineothrix sedimenti TaxID=3123317 RepID=A0ABZ3EVY7_9FIRM
MKEFTSCKMATQHCITNKYFALAHLYSDEKTMDMHIHDCCEIYYSISGGKQFLIDNRFYDIRPGDIFFINQYESHYLTQVDTGEHERIVISVHPDYLQEISSDQTDLSYCFTHRFKGLPHRLHLDPEMSKRFIYLIHKIADSDGFGFDLMERAAFSDLMVFLNRTFYESCHKAYTETVITNHAQVDDILNYINLHISEDITLERLSEYFYLSSSYLCRIFKSTTGTTINKYITARRITIAKALLNEGITVMEACSKCGFNDYSNFLKAFTKAVGISPKKYAQFNS